MPHELARGARDFSLRTYFQSVTFSSSFFFFPFDTSPAFVKPLVSNVMANIWERARKPPIAALNDAKKVVAGAFELVPKREALKEHASEAWWVYLVAWVGLRAATGAIKWAKNLPPANPNEEDEPDEPPEKEQVLESDASSALKELKNSVCSNYITQRKAAQQLRNLVRMLDENQASFRHALYFDFGWHITDAVLALAIVRREARMALRHLKKWQSPKRVDGVCLMTFPSNQWIRYEPVGVALIISAWNAPIVTLLQPLVGALAAGCSVLLKPNFETRHTAQLMERLLPAYMDSRVVKMLGPGYEHDHEAVNDALCAPPDVNCPDIVFFTGGARVARIINQEAAKRLIPTVMELGGNNPLIVSSDANLDLAAKQTVLLRFFRTGQVCVCPNTAFCEPSVVEQFAEKCVQYANAMFSTDPKENQMGKIISPSRVERLQRLLASSSGSILCGGSADPKKRHFDPTVVLLNSREDPLIQEEIFGPILAIVAVDSAESFIREHRMSNARPLISYIFTTDQRLMSLASSQLQAGSVNINSTFPSALIRKDLPFGGAGGLSGYGNYHHIYGARCFQYEKPVFKRTRFPYPPFIHDPNILYPPFPKWKVDMMRTFAKLISI